MQTNVNVKLQEPRDKFQTNSNIQNPKFQIRVWSFEFGTWMLFGNLVLASWNLANNIPGKKLRNLR
jgi:hypothetical protein